jgi:hypothetical protein
MEAHNWRCTECSRPISAFGIMSLSLSIRNHEREAHGLLTNRTLEEIERAPNYWKTPNIGPQPQYTEPKALCSGANRPTLEEHRWLEQLKVLWDGDMRGPEELARRYKELI